MAKTISNTAAKIRDRGDTLAEQWRNGNRKAVVGEILTGTRAEASYYTAHLGQCLLTGDVRVLMGMVLDAAVEEKGPSEL
jgi:hypothetical protein